MAPNTTYQVRGLQGDRTMRHTVVIHEYDEHKASTHAWRYDITRIACEDETDADSGFAAGMEALTHARRHTPNGCCVYTHAVAS